MQIHQLQTKKRQARKRVGRGGIRGTYCGRGMNGQKSRSGGNVDPLFEGGRSSLTMRMKKVRGFHSPHAKNVVVRLAQLEKIFADGDTVSPDLLVERGVINKKNITNGVVVVATGVLKKKLTIGENIRVSDAAKKAIEKAGGSIVEKKEKETKKK